MESWLHDEDVQLDEDEQLVLEGRLEGGLELVDLEPEQTAAAQQVATSGRNLFLDLFYRMKVFTVPVVNGRNSFMFLFNSCLIDIFNFLSNGILITLFPNI